ncbi:CBS domain-containing protein [Saccharobesus litoralis]|uniref:CBS domain-containing protein n=1 Tax=Saccharobesus litoralis TaxID=2172099 RepID=A0A2S0VU43_9ALTE|nr:CBS domain-containing protein [Saccharobesus litoralis]AWB67729.1 CBS domain-containing protein [Saccharobesus litoralis]
MESIQVQDYMKRAVTFTKDMSVAVAVERLIDSNQSGGPVVDGANKVIGFVSEQDCITRMLESTMYREAVASVGDFMVTEVKAVKPYDSVIELAQSMARSRPRIYPVVDDDGFLMGIITRHDCMVAIDHHLHDAYHAIAS